MRIAAISVQKYRSIKRTPRINLSELTVLIGPNNEGKSNVLRALATSMQVVRLYGLTQVAPTTRTRVGTRRRVPTRLYDWSEDFPKDLQEKTPEGNTIIDLWFELTDDEQSAFHESVGSKLRTELPIRLTIGPQTVEFTVRKQGPGGATLTKKAAAVAAFIGRALRVEHVESVRTADRARRVVKDMVELELDELESEQEFATALETLVAAVKPMTDRLSLDLADTLRAFLPDVRDVSIELGTDRILSALASQVQITVDDGVATGLQHKGDGVQSLAALALIRKAADVRRGALILAIEEPEAHLHPRAVHQLRQVLNDIATTQQVVLTTHSPALVNRSNLQHNVLVRSNRASPATSLEDIRDALGIRVSDNLSQASLVLLVEGGCDSEAMTALLSHHSETLADAMSTGLLAVESLGSASNLAARLDALRNTLCRYHVLLDDDEAGRTAAEKARLAGLLTSAEENFVRVPGLKDAEFEDALDSNIYREVVRSSFGVNLAVNEFRNGKAKWSGRVEAAFRAQGKGWNDRTKVAVKKAVAGQVAADPASALHSKRAGSIVALVSELERRLAEV